MAVTRWPFGSNRDESHGFDMRVTFLLPICAGVRMTELRFLQAADGTTYTGQLLAPRRASGGNQIQVWYLASRLGCKLVLHQQLR